jgi:hypothetical protein
VNAHGERWGSLEIVERRPVSDTRKASATQKIQSKKIGTVQSGYDPTQSYTIKKKG